MKFVTNKNILFLILIVAIVLRFYNFFQIPFTHDEFSALFRLNFDNFTDLIEKGIKIDGHPAGVQIFLYLWTKLFGSSEWIVKFPFAIAGVISVFLIFLIGKEWFNETVGLLSAAYIASIQYTVMYSQIARPYSFGLLFTLAMVYFWSKLIKKPEKKTTLHLILYIFFSTLSVYNHYFSFLFAIIVGTVGIFIIEKKYKKILLISAIVVFILFIPHLPIFFYQIKIGGVGTWLSKPHPDFFLNYLFYLFQYSKEVIVTTSILIFITLLNASKKYPFKKIFIFLIFFNLPIIIGYLYSVYINPVLQFSVLIFSFPYLYFILFGYINNLKPKSNLLLIIFILIINVYSLIFVRQHYKLFYNSIYEKILKDYSEIKKDKNNILAFVYSHKKITQYYIDKYKYTLKFTWLNDIEKESVLIDILNKNFKKYDFVYIGATSFIKPDFIPIFLSYYPYAIKVKNYVGGTTYLLSKNGNYKLDSLFYLVDFEKQQTNIKYWKSNKCQIKKINSNSMCLLSQEWGPGFEIPLDTLTDSKFDFIDIYVDVFLQDSCNSIHDITLVTEFRTNDKKIYWNGYNFKDFVYNVPISNHKLINSIKLSDIYLNYDDLTLKTYIWNKNKEKFYLDNFTIKVRKGNPYVYGLVQKIQ